MNNSNNPDNSKQSKSKSKSITKSKSKSNFDIDEMKKSISESVGTYCLNPNAKNILFDFVDEMAKEIDGDILESVEDISDDKLYSIINNVIDKHKDDGYSGHSFLGSMQPYIDYNKLEKNVDDLISKYTDADPHLNNLINDYKSDPNSYFNKYKSNYIYPYFGKSYNYMGNSIPTISAKDVDEDHLNNLINKYNDLSKYKDPPIKTNNDISSNSNFGNHIPSIKPIKKKYYSTKSNDYLMDIAIKKANTDGIPIKCTLYYRKTDSDYNNIIQQWDKFKEIVNMFGGTEYITNIFIEEINLAAYNDFAHIFKYSGNSKTFVTIGTNDIECVKDVPITTGNLFKICLCYMDKLKGVLDTMGISLDESNILIELKDSDGLDELDDDNLVIEI